MGGGPGRRRILIAASTLLGLLAVVGLASRAHTPTGGGGTRALDGDILLEYALVLLMALAVVVVPVAIWMYVVNRKEEDVLPSPRRNWMPAVLLTMCGFAVVSTLLLGGNFLRRHHSHPRSPVEPLVRIADRGARAPRAVRFDWMPVIVVSSLTLGGLAAAAAAFVRRREPSTPRVAAEVLVAALERTIDDLRAEPDPRRAVIAAYAQMEGDLGRAGLPHRAWEAPREYLRRVLPELGAGADSVDRLTGLFERARFSPHAIDAAMKDDAIAALERLRDELRGTA
jgi:Domain of unknown function (DUF4129)